MKNWYDFETSDASHSSQILQFASVSTDDDLNVIPGSENNLIVKPRKDMLISPHAAMVHMLDPEYLEEHGITEREVVEKVINLFLFTPQSQQCGYNTMKFDDAILRHSAFRNMFSPYQHEFLNGNSRFDAFKLVQFVYALRPELLVFGKKDDGKDSMKLESLAKENGIIHERAHDALSDVYATIGIAKIIRDKNRKLYDYVQSLTVKANNERLAVGNEPLIHVSFKFGQENRLSSMIYPLVRDENNKNKYIYVDLRVDPYNMLNMSAEELRHYMFTKRDQLPEDAPKVPVGNFQINDLPLIIKERGLLTDDLSAKLNLDRDQCFKHLEMIKASRDLRQRLQMAHRYESEQPKHIFNTLYSGGFISNADQGQRNAVTKMSDEEVAQIDAVEMSNKRDDKFRMLELLVGMKEMPTDPIEKAVKYRQLKTMLIDDDSRLNFSKFDEAIQQIRINNELSEDQELMLEKIIAQRESIEGSFLALQSEVFAMSKEIDEAIEKKGYKWLSLYMNNEFPSGALEVRKDEPSPRSSPGMTP